MTAWVASSSLALKSKLEFKEENANHKSRPLIAIDERMIADNASCIQSGHFDNIRSAGIGVVLARTRKG